MTRRSEDSLFYQDPNSDLSVLQPIASDYTSCLFWLFHRLKG
jgi:hypothetical protein